MVTQFFHRQSPQSSARKRFDQRVQQRNKLRIVERILVVVREKVFNLNSANATGWLLYLRTAGLRADAGAAEQMPAEGKACGDGSSSATRFNLMLRASPGVRVINPRRSSVRII